MKTKFYICRHCGNMIEMVKDAGVNVVCCGEKMTALVPNTTDAAGEKHVPVVTVSDGSVRVNVGSVTHPMTDAHYITFIALETDKGIYRKDLTPKDAPDVTFHIGDEKPVAAYEYCNLHGLWASEI